VPFFSHRGNHVSVLDRFICPSTRRRESPPVLARLRSLSPCIPIILAALIFSSPFQLDAEAAKRKARPVKPPDLRLITVTVSPDPYVAGDGVVNFNVEIELPNEFEEGTLLEVSSLISSPSMSSMGFLSVRQPLSPPSPDGAEPHVKAKMNVTLSWDGMNQANRRVGGGRYHYEVRAKLLMVRDNVPRTLMSAWPKRGMLKVMDPQ
ncbi:MAG: hypothetical protein ACREJU_08350, partial [Nitrospiraceae bacterium]